MNGIDEQIKLVSKILSGEISKMEVAKELKRISETYGEECFNSYEVKRKPKPWTEQNLKELEILNASGAGSKEFYLYMAEVSEEVYAQKAKKKKLLTGVLFGVLIVVAVIIMVSILRNVM